VVPIADSRTDQVTFNEVIESLERLDGWVERNGWAGYDPYDLKGHPFFIRLLAAADRNIIFRIGAEGILEMTNLCPMFFRRVFRINQRIITKEMGLFAAAYLSLYRQFNRDVYLKKASECLAWLEHNKSQGYAGDCWGYPFDWQAVMFIPAGTPSAVVSSICGDAFWDFYKFTGESRYLSTCISICEFLIGSLNIDRVGDDRLCFSYTPLDRTHVHNANLFAAEFLCRIGKETGREQFIQYGLQALNYTLADQTEDGAFYYRALVDRPMRSRKEIDHYHTGFVLRSLYNIYQNTREKKAFEALSRGYRYYRDNLFEKRMIPGLRPQTSYPVNIHSCAEAILCLSRLSEVFPDAMEYACNAFRWTRDNMQDNDGHFYYLKNRFEWRTVKVGRGISLPYFTPGQTVKIPYIRWGQAWMMRALASLATCR
jgi:rhamnogalacturonyl hydrolase YesR